MVSNVVTVAIPTDVRMAHYSYAGTAKALAKTQVRSRNKAVGLCILGFIGLLSFVVTIYAGLQNSMWLLIAGLGPLLTSGLAILRIWASTK